MDWIHFTLKDFIDVLLVSTVLYYTYKTLRTSGSRTLFTGIIAFFILWVVVYRVLDMKLLGAIMNKFIGVGFIVLVILFQEEIRRFLNVLGSTKRWAFLGKLFGKEQEQLSSESNVSAALVLAVLNMARKKMGALIVIEGQTDLEPYEHTGEMIDADVNARLVENIFFKNSPMHDGAMIVSGSRIVAAGCILPVAQGAVLPKEMGLRHRSGLGMALQTDAKVIIVSEERGKISVAYRGEIIPIVDADGLRMFLDPHVKDLQVLHQKLQEQG